MSKKYGQEWREQLRALAKDIGLSNLRFPNFAIRRKLKEWAGRPAVKDGFAFYWTCFKETFHPSLGFSDLCASIFGMLFPFIAKFIGANEATMNSLYWQVPLCTFIAFGAVRLILSPYFIWRKLRDAYGTLFDKTRPAIEVSRCTIRKTARFTEFGTPTGDSQWVMLSPKCLTDVPVSGCRAHLVNIFKKYKSTWQSLDIEPISLQWSVDHEKEIVLEPKAERKIDVCFYYLEKPYWQSLIPAATVHSEIDLKIPGIYSFDIKVSADCCSPAFVSVEVDVRESRKMTCTLKQGLTMDALQPVCVVHSA